MWFVILKTLVPGQDSGTWSSQPEMLLVADDANAAYSNPRVLPKRADFPAVYRFSLPHRRPSERRPASARPRIIQTALALLVGTLTSVTWDIGVRTSPARPRTGVTSSRRPARGKATRDRGSTRHRVTATATTTTTPRTARATATSPATATGATRSRSRDSTASATPTGRSRRTESPAATTSRAVTASPADYGYQQPAGPEAGYGLGQGAESPYGQPGPVRAARAGLRPARRRPGLPGAERRLRPAGRLPGHGTAAPAATPRRPTAATATRAGTPGTTGTAASPPPRRAPASPTPARTR